MGWSDGYRRTFNQVAKEHSENKLSSFCGNHRNRFRASLRTPVWHAPNRPRARYCAQRKGSRLYKLQKTIVLCPANRRLEAFGTMKADFLMRRIGGDARGFLCSKGVAVSEVLVLLDKRDLFKEGAIALEALSETTNDADSVVMNPPASCPSSLRLGLPRILPMKRAFWRAPVSRAGSSSSQGSFQSC
jgi:hypothetical protein